MKNIKHRKKSHLGTVLRYEIKILDNIGINKEIYVLKLGI